MNPRETRSLLARLVVFALPLSTLQGCPLIGGSCPPPNRSYTLVLGDGGVSDAGLTDAGCATACMPSTSGDESLTRCSFTEVGGKTAVVCDTSTLCVAGRRPEGLAVATPSARDALGEFLARQAHLEAASVPAFQRLASDLLLHGAPLDLVHRALRAAADEERHADLMTAAALRHDARPSPVQIPGSRTRTLEEIAIENAVEGCSRETLGAMIALWQSHTAADPWLRRTMSLVAEDELAHAELAWDVDTWARSRLPQAAAARVDDARRAALDQLAEELRAPVPQILHAQLGLPDPASAHRLLAAARVYIEA